MQLTAFGHEVLQIITQPQVQQAGVQAIVCSGSGRDSQVVLLRPFDPGWSMAMPVVCVWYVRVTVCNRFMLVPMVVGDCWHEFVHMVMVSVVMPV